MPFGELDGRIKLATLVVRGRVVPIRPFLAGQTFESEDVDVLGLAFEEACEALGLSSTVDDPVTRAVAEKVIEFYQRGVRDPDKLRETVLEEFGPYTG
jgi:hypothetical protein